MCQKNLNLNLLNLKFRQASNHCKRVLEAAKTAYTNKTKEFITSQKLGPWDFLRIAYSVFIKGKSAIPLLFNDPDVLSFSSGKEKLFPKTFPKISNLDGSVSLYLFLNLELI